jgi:hypothetical protein
MNSNRKISNWISPEELPIEEEIKESGEKEMILEEIPSEEEIEEDSFPFKEERLTEKVLEMENELDKQQIIKELSLDKQKEKEDLFQKEVNIKEELLAKELVTEKEEIIEKIKNHPISITTCQFYGFNNPEDARYCLQCGQTVKK